MSTTILRPFMQLLSQTMVFSFTLCVQLIIYTLIWTAQTRALPPPVISTTMPPTTTTPFPVLLIPRVNLEVSQEPNITARPPAHPGNAQPQPSWQLLVGLVLGAFLFLLILLCYWLSIPCTTSQIVKTMRDEQEMVQKQKQKARDERFSYERYP